MAIGLIIECAIGFVTVRKMHQKRNMNRQLQIVFLVTLLGACSATIAGIVGTVMLMLSFSFPNACLVIFIGTTYFFWISIWSTLVLRYDIVIQ